VASNWITNPSSDSLYAVNAFDYAGISATVSGDVTLAASQPSYAPAKAGDAMTLTSAYDAAKTAGPSASTIAAAILTTPANKLATDASGNVTTTNPGGGATAQQVWEYAIRALTDKADFDLVDAPNATAIAAIQNGLATTTALATVAGYLDTEVAAIKAVTDALGTAIMADGAVYQFTANALELGPSGGLDAAGMRAAVGLAAANLDTQLGAAATEATLTAIKGATWSGSTDTLEAIRDRGDAAWTTATGFSTLNAQAVRDSLKLAPTTGAPATGSVDALLAALPGAVWTVATSTLTTAGSIGAALVALAGKFTGITVLANWLKAMIRSSTPDTTALAEINLTGGTYAVATDSLEAIGEKAQLITEASVSISSWVLTDSEDRALYRGASYSAVNNNAITAEDLVTTWPDLSTPGTTVELRFLPITSGMSSLIGAMANVVDPCPDVVVTGAVTGTRAIQFELTSLETLALTAGFDAYQAQAWATVNGNDVPLTYWTVSVLDGKQDCPEPTT
jgi:hypothetical protein